MTRLRQAVLVAADLDHVVGQVQRELQLDVGFHDPGVAEFGLRNAVLPVGDQFLEVVSPMQDGTTAGRFLDRKGGDGGYMVIVQVDDEEAVRARSRQLGLRTVWQMDVPASRSGEPAIKGTHLHPKDVGGTILSFDQPDPPSSWRWGGPEWPDHVRTGLVDGIRAIEIAVRDPAAVGRTWGELFGAPVESHPSGAEVLELADEGSVRFVPADDDASVGVCGIDLHLAPGAARDDTVIAGVRFRFIARS